MGTYHNFLHITKHEVTSLADCITTSLHAKQGGSTFETKFEVKEIYFQGKLAVHVEPTVNC